MSTRLNKLLPDVAGLKRESLLQANAFVQWIRKNKPDAYKEAMKVLGKECQVGLDDLNNSTNWWR